MRVFLPTRSSDTCLLSRRIAFTPSPPSLPPSPSSFPSFLNLSSAGTIYCSEITGALLIGKLGIKPQFVHMLPMERPTTIEVRPPSLPP